MQRSTIAILSGTLLLAMASATADSIAAITIEQLYLNKANLNGKQVSIQGKVVKVTNNVMQKNFLHIRDGSGQDAEGTDDVTVTSLQTAEVGDPVTVTGTVVLDLDLGAGYTYPVLIEQATITKLVQ
jgi:hypothetical protein